VSSLLVSAIVLAVVFMGGVVGLQLQSALPADSDEAGHQFQ
jgi:hypothetical protein